MASIERKPPLRRTRFVAGLIGSLGLLGLSVLAAPAEATPRDPNCFDQLKKERSSILNRFAKLQNYKTYTDAKARALQDRVEKYLLAIGDVLKNFDLKIFFEDELSKIPAVKGLSQSDRALLEEVLRPSFESRRLPPLKDFRARLVDRHLGDLPYRKIRDTMDRSFGIWRTKLVFDETGHSVYNRLAKAYVRKMGLGEFSMQLGLLGKNEWEAFFEAEKGKGIFNPSLPGLLNDLFTSTEAHESVHLVVETLAADGHESPYAVWIKLDQKYRKTGAIGDRQMNALRAAEDPLSDGDYYRTELYLDEFPAHVIQSAFLNVQLSKAVHEKFLETVGAVREATVRDELEEAFAEYLRSEGKVDWSGYRRETKLAFRKFLTRKASDGRTQIAKLLGEMTEYVNWIDLIQNSGSTAVYRAREVLDREVSEAAEAGRKWLRPEPGDPVQILPDEFLGIKGYKIEIRVPIDVLRSDGTYRTAENAATVSFRFTREGKLTRSITESQIEKLRKRMDWIAQIGKESKAAISDYADFLDENGALTDYTIEDVFEMKFIHTRLRKLTRKTLERIRENHP